MQRFSKKRQSIIDCLKNTNVHPNAEWIYNKLKPIYPNLSLATVYRNLSELERSGEICCIDNVLGKERFDAKTEPHIHVICKRCGKVIDAEEIVLPQNLLDKVQDVTKFSVSCSKLEFIGICEECKDKERQ